MNGASGGSKVLKWDYLRTLFGRREGKPIDKCDGKEYNRHMKDFKRYHVRFPAEYRAWSAMKDRCLNPNHSAYSYYGGRGIAVCDRWLSFANFLEDMGVRPHGRSLDRIDNAGNYEPTNCRWATWSQQMKNRRGWKQPKAVTVATRRKVVYRRTGRFTHELVECN